MSRWKEVFAFNKQEQRGVFFLLLAIFLLQGFYFLLRGGYFSTREAAFKPDSEQQRFLDSLEQVTREGEKTKLYQFNPNFISEFRGYTLGMTALELDRLYAFRKRNNFINSAGEFQKVTGVSDSMLKILTPLFQFPQWASNKTARKKPLSPLAHETTITVKDLNKTTAGDLQQINGIGTVLSKRIIRFRDALGGFLQDDQLYDVYGLEAEVVERTLKYFKVTAPPEIVLININTASVEELAQLIYISFPLAEAIVRYREKVGYIGSFDEISDLEGFPSDKIERIKLYLRL